MIDIISEPSDQIYVDLLRFGMQFCSSFSLTWRDQAQFNQSASDIEITLRPFLLRESYTDAWPGTRLYKAKARVRFYRLTVQSLEILLRTSSLYAWLEPNLPEDLALYKADGSCWLLSIAHELDSAISDEQISVVSLRTAVPGIAVKVHEKP